VVKRLCGPKTSAKTRRKDLSVIKACHMVGGRGSLEASLRARTSGRVRVLAPLWKTKEIAERSLR